ncbi:MAG: hypothetical protein QXZ41_07105 [Ignisphaera sp.]
MPSNPGITATIFAQVLRDYGIRVVAIDKRILFYTPTTSKNSSEDLLAYLAISLLLGKIQICIDEAQGTPTGFYKGIVLLSTVRKGIYSDAIISRRDIPCTKDVTLSVREKLLQILPRTPVFIIDLSLWELHHDKEKYSLIKQLAVAINTIRKWLTDLNIVFVSAPSEIRQRLRILIPNIVAYFSSEEFYKSLDPQYTVVLDPYASDELTEYDVYKYSYFIIGGVVDRLYPRPYATYMIYKLNRLSFPRKAIKLRDSIIGVPNELNKVIDLILSTKLINLSLEESILRNMGVDDRLIRVMCEVEKIIKSKINVDLEYLKTIAKFYGLEEEQFLKVISKIKGYGVLGGNT